MDAAKITNLAYSMRVPGTLSAFLCLGERCFCDDEGGL